jgi:hypothetical protein
MVATRTKGQQKLIFIQKNMGKRVAPEAAWLFCVGAPAVVVTNCPRPMTTCAFERDVFVACYEAMIRKSFGMTDEILINEMPKYCRANLKHFFNTE